MFVSIAMVGNDTNENSSINVNIFKKNNCFRKRKNAETPVPKLPEKKKENGTHILNKQGKIG